MSTKYSGLIHFYFYKVSGTQLHLLFKKGRDYYSDRIPRYTLNNNNIIVHADVYFQFIPENDQGEYILFAYETSDYLLAEEFNHASITGFEFSIDINSNSVNLNDLKALRIPTPTVGRMEIEWYRDNWTGEYDADYSLELLKRKKT